MNEAPSVVRSMLNAATLLPMSDAGRSPILFCTSPADDGAFIVTLPDFQSGSPMTTGGGSFGTVIDVPGPGMVSVMFVPVVGSARGPPSCPSPAHWLPIVSLNIAPTVSVRTASFGRAFRRSHSFRTQVFRSFSISSWCSFFTLSSESNTM